MSKTTLNDITTGYSGPARINANFDAIEDAIENTLSRDGTGPNQMEANFDMNGYRILNISSPQSPTDPARLVDITGLIELTGMPIPAVTGNAGKLLHTDGVDLYWGDVTPDSMPLFTTSDRGAVPESPGMLDTVVLWGDGEWVAPEDRDLVLSTINNTFTKGQRFETNVLTYASNLAINTSLSNIHKLTLTGNSVLTFTNAVDGTVFDLYLVQDGTGDRTVSWPAVTWIPGEAPFLKNDPGDVDVIRLYYDGSTWFGNYDATAAEDDEDAGDFDLALTVNQDNVDVFRRLGSPLSAQTWTVLIDYGVVISSRSTAVQALDFSGAFPSGTIINVTNRGYVIGKGGRGANGAPLSASGAVDIAFAYSPGTAGGDAIKGPATGVTVNIANSAGRIWGGGGGGGQGGASSSGGVAVGGAGGGGAGCGQGGLGAHMKMNGDVTTVASASAADGVLGLDGSDAGGAGAAGADSGSGNAGDGGDGGDYGEAGENGAAATDVGLIIANKPGGAAGRAITAGYAGTLTFTSGSGSPNVKGSV